jgi:hypothetical protein
MKLIKVADRVERYIEPHLLSEYKVLKSQFKALSDKFVDHLDKDKYDPKDIRWVNQFEELKREMKILDEKLSIIKNPAVEKMEENRSMFVKREEEQKRRTKEIFEKAEHDTSFQIKIEEQMESWPRTNNPSLAGYIMQDGSMLNMSYQGYQRDMDHREITQEIDDLDGGTDGMRQFQLATGAIRMHAQGNGYVSFDWEVEPTRSQKRKMIEVSEPCAEIRILDRKEEMKFDSYWEMQEEMGWY